MVSLGPRREQLWAQILDTREPGRPWSLTQALCDRAEEVLDIDAAAISVHLSQSRRDLPAAGSALASTLEELQFTTGEGPSTDAVRSRGKVLVANLADLRWRWPLFLEPALRCGANAVFAFPVPSASGGIIAALTLYRRRGGPLSAPDATTAAALWELASRALHEDTKALTVTDPTADDLGGWTGHFHAAHIASGILAVQHEVDVEAAMALLRARALTHGQPLLALAEKVCTRRTMTD